MSIKRFNRMCVLALIPLLLSGCSSFNSQWRSTESLDNDRPEGCWEGSWESSANGHHGPLRCIITNKEDGNHLAAYKAGYMKVLQFEHELTKDMKKTETGWAFSGSEDIGAMSGGLYSFSGTIKGPVFHSTYSNKWDKGTFDMKKVIKPTR